MTGRMRLAEPVDLTATRFREAMSRAITGVSVVATDGPAGRLGLTVSAVTSVSAEPPQVLVCINRRSPLTAAISANGHFTVNLLADDQQSLADVFAGRTPDAYDFARATWTSARTGSPILKGAIASFDCRLTDAVDAGTHRIAIGAVIDVRLPETDAGALAYVQRAYGRFTPFVRQQSATRVLA